jgi:spore coat protein SA
MKIAFVAQPFDRMVPPVRVGSLALWIYYMAQRVVAQGHEALIVGNNGGRLRGTRMEHEGVHYALTPTFIDAQINRVGRRLARMGSKAPNASSDYVFASWFHSHYARLAAKEIRDRDVDIVHIMNYSQFVPIVRKQNPRAVIALHMQCEWLTQFPRDVIERRLDQVDLVVGCSEYITKLVAGAFPRFAEKCVTVPNAADVVAEEDAARPGGAKVLFVGRLSPEKGVHDLIDAFRQVLEHVPHATLHLVGAPGWAPLEYLVGLSDIPYVKALRRFYELPPAPQGKDPYQVELERLAGPEIGQRIIFEGYADHHVIAEHYRTATVLTNPSLSESFGISLVEAMMMKIPVVATRVGGMAYTVVPGETGLLVDPADPQRLADALRSVLSDPELARRMGAAGRVRSCNHFSWESSARTLLDVFSMARTRKAGA